MYENSMGYSNPERSTVYDQDLRYKDAEAQKRIAEISMGREEFEPKVRKRRTIDEQIEFNHQLLCQLEKQIAALREQLSPVIVQENEVAKEASGVVALQTEMPENHSTLMCKLLDTSDKINWLMRFVASILARLQV